MNPQTLPVTQLSIEPRIRHLLPAVALLLVLCTACSSSPFALVRAEASERADDGLATGSDLNGFGLPEASAVDSRLADRKSLSDSGREAWTPNAGSTLPTAEDLASFREQFLGDRLLKREATATIRVSSIENAIERLIDEAKAAGGYVVSRSDNTISVRIASESYESTWTGVRSYGDVLSQNEFAYDVTEEHRDLDIRLRNLRKAHERLLTLLESATKVEDLLEIEKELRRLTLEIERLTAQKQNLTRDIAFSLLRITFVTYEQPVYSPSERTPGEPSTHAWIRELGIRNLLEDF